MSQPSSSLERRAYSNGPDHLSLSDGSELKNPTNTRDRRPMSMYRKMALVEAEQFLPAEDKIPAGVYSSGPADPRKSAEQWMLRTLEGEHVLRDGDYICTGPAGEKWNVAREIFEATYEPAEPAPSRPTHEGEGG